MLCDQYNIYCNFLYNNLSQKMKRQIKKSKVIYNEQNNKQIVRQRSRSREKQKQKETPQVKEIKVQTVDPNSRRALLMKMKQREQQQKNQSIIKQQHIIETKPVQKSVTFQRPVKIESVPQQDQSQQQDQNQNDQQVLLKPVYVSKDQRDTIRHQEELLEKKMHQEQRKLKINKLNTRLILNQTMVAEGDQHHDSDQQDSDKGQLPDDDDTRDEALQYELWKIRELKRIRRDKQERQRLMVSKAEIQRRRKLTDQQRIAQNKLLGSDSTAQKEQTKYVFMQKYYHKGAFYQDNQDEIYKRDYNLPTPLELQDKSLLPKILQKRKNDFGKKGQSKYTHLTEQDTTNFDPQFRPDETILVSLQRKLGGYKGAFMNKR